MSKRDFDEGFNAGAASALETSVSALTAMLATMRDPRFRGTAATVIETWAATMLGEAAKLKPGVRK